MGAWVHEECILLKSGRGVACVFAILSLFGI